MLVENLLLELHATEEGHVGLISKPVCVFIQGLSFCHSAEAKDDDYDSVLGSIHSLLTYHLWSGKSLSRVS